MNGVIYPAFLSMSTAAMFCCCVLYTQQCREYEKTFSTLSVIAAVELGVCLRITYLRWKHERG